MAAMRLPLLFPIASPLLFLLLLLPFLSLCSSSLESVPLTSGGPPAPPFPAALESLQKRLGYSFKAVDLLRRAVTHPSFSRENYRSLTILGLDAVRAAVALRRLRLRLDPDVSPGDLSRRLTADTGGEACAADGLRLGLQGVVRVAAGTTRPPQRSSAAPSAPCSAPSPSTRATSAPAAKCSGGSMAGRELPAARPTGNTIKLASLEEN